MYLVIAVLLECLILVFSFLLNEANVNAKEFFDDLASKKGFDPIMDCHCWFEITHDDVLAEEVCECE